MVLAGHISSYGCTWEVWRALKKLEFLSPRAPLTLLSALQTSRVHPSLDTAVSKEVVPQKCKSVRDNVDWHYG